MLGADGGAGFARSGAVARVGSAFVATAARGFPAQNICAPHQPVTFGTPSTHYDVLPVHQSTPRPTAEGPQGADCPRCQARVDRVGGLRTTWRRLMETLNEGGESDHVLATFYSHELSDSTLLFPPNHQLVPIFGVVREDPTDFVEVSGGIRRGCIPLKMQQAYRSIEALYSPPVLRESVKRGQLSDSTALFVLCVKVHGKKPRSRIFRIREKRSLVASSKGSV